MPVARCMVPSMLPTSLRHRTSQDCVAFEYTIRPYLATSISYSFNIARLVEKMDSMQYRKLCCYQVRDLQSLHV